MKILFALLLIILGPCAQAQAIKKPPCWPKELDSTGSAWKTGSTKDARWLGWTCRVAGVPKVFGIVVLKDYELKHPIEQGLSTVKTAEAYWALNVRANNDPLLNAARVEMAVAFSSRP